MQMRLSTNRPYPGCLAPVTTPDAEERWEVTNGEIAHRLTISSKTVERHRATIVKEVRVSNTALPLKSDIRDQLITFP